jgi:hypothetical protein
MSSSVTFSVWNNKIIDRCLGQFSIKLADLERERVYDMWCDIVPRSEKNKDQVAGKVHIRMYISFMKVWLPLFSLQFFPFPSFHSPFPLPTSSLPLQHSCRSPYLKVEQINFISLITSLISLPSRPGISSFLAE